MLAHALQRKYSCCLTSTESFLGCNAASEQLTGAESDSVLTLPSQVLNSKSDFSGSVEVMAVEKVFKVGKAALLANKMANVWKRSPRMDTKQPLRRHVLRLV